jgi:hypothetical protein
MCICIYELLHAMDGGVLSSLRSVLFNFCSNSHVLSIVYFLAPFHYHKAAQRYSRFPREVVGRGSGAVGCELAIGGTSGLVLVEATDCSSTTTTTTTTTTTHRFKTSGTSSAV